eukprot:811342-Rhodomonas_salina.1
MSGTDSAYGATRWYKTRSSATSVRALGSGTRCPVLIRGLRGQERVLCAPRHDQRDGTLPRAQGSCLLLFEAAVLSLMAAALLFMAAMLSLMAAALPRMSRDAALNGSLAAVNRGTAATNGR